jgi:RNA-binding protein
MFFERGIARLQKMGRVRAVTPSKNMIVKADKPPKLGSEVVDENLTVVGRVFDVIGPVSAPYAVIKPSMKEPEKTLNKPMYLLLSKTSRGKR